MNWATKNLGDIVALQRGFDLAKSKRTPGPYPILSAGRQEGTHVNAKIEGPGFVIGRATNLGKPQWSESDYWPLNTTLFAKDFKGNNPRWLFHLFEVLDLTGYDSGSVQPMLNRNYIEKVPVRVPPRDVQDSIVEVLGSLDNKIAANSAVLSRSNDLIRARYARLPESECTLGDTADLVRHSQQPRNFQTDRRLIGLEHFDPKSLWLARSSSPESATSAKNCFEAGDTLFGKLRPYFHKVAIAPFDGYCSTDVLVLRAKDPDHGPLVAAAANSDSVVQQAVNSSNGTRMPRAKWSDIENCSIPDPAAAVTKEFTELARTLTKDATVRLQENLTLTKTRDELLPLLMSGKITVQEATAAGADIAGEESGA